MAIRGRLSFAAGKWSDAQMQLRRAVEMLRSDSEVDRAHLSAPLIHLAQVAFILGDKNASLEHAREAFDIDRQIYGAEHPEAQANKAILNAIEVFVALLREDGQCAPDWRTTAAERHDGE